MVSNMPVRDEIVFFLSILAKDYIIKFTSLPCLLKMMMVDS